MAVDQGWTQLRPDLDRRLDGALTHRLTTLIAAAGYGKSTALAAWARAVGAASYRLSATDQDLTKFVAGVITALRLRMPAVTSDIVAAVDAPRGPDAVADELTRASALASSISENMGEHLAGNLVLVLDGLECLTDSAGPCRFVDTLVRTTPPGLHVVIASRDALPFPIARLRQDHDVLEFDAADLALTVDETSAWLRRRIGDSGTGFASALHNAVGGWPAATHAAIDAMAAAEPAEWPTLATNVTATSTVLTALTRRVFNALSGEAQRLLRAATVLPSVTGQLAEVLGVPSGTLTTIASRGLFLETDADGSRITPTGRQVLDHHAPLADDEAQDVAAVAARWYVEHEAPDLALRAAVAAGHVTLIKSLLAEHGEKLVEHPDDVLAAFDQLAEVDQPGADQSAPQTDLEHIRLAGLAHFNRGDWDRALAKLAEAAKIGIFDSAVAYRIGLIDHLRGDFDSALHSYRDGAEFGRPAADAIMCTAMAASVRWLRGDRTESAALAETARDQATRLGDHRALAAAHTVLAMVAAFDGDGRANDAHYLKALDLATQAGDVAQQIRIRCNRASHRHTEGAFTEALEELEIAIRLCDLTGFAPWAALARSNRADALIRLGRLEEASVEAADAAERWQAMGSRLLGYGLTRQAQIQLLRGHVRAAGEMFERAADLAEQSGDAQGLNGALTGMAELLVEEQPDVAVSLAERAAARHVGTAVVPAWLAQARAALAAGRPSADVRNLLDRAEAEAQRRNEQASLAQVAQLRAMLGGDLAMAGEAIDRWQAIGDPIGLARAELVRASLIDPHAGAKTAADVRVRMQAIGCRSLDREIESLLARATPGDPRPIAIQTLGVFRVQRSGVPISSTEWQSRKARDLLKILLTRRGRSVPRDQLVERLWPESATDPAALKRLNVMVSTLRSVLDPDHSWASDRFVISTAGAIRIEINNDCVDVFNFLDLVTRAGRLDHAGRTAEAIELWRAAETAYTGDFCEEDPYADWAAGLREEARLAYAQAAARIADWEAGAGHYEQAARYWLRLLERDPYDERAHLALVLTLDQAGRRGDARRRYQAYADLMRELDIEPSPHPA